MMEDKERTVVVTGCNKGIGYGIVEHLVKCPIMNVIMACRNVDKANKAKQ
jgi:carbonyl reductase 1/carbonyl reductase 3